MAPRRVYLPLSAGAILTTLGSFLQIGPRSWTLAVMIDVESISKDFSPADTGRGACEMEFTPASRPRDSRETQLCSQLQSTGPYYTEECGINAPIVIPSSGCNLVMDKEKPNPEAWMPQKPTTIMLWGDSLGRQLTASLFCVLSRLVPPDQVGNIERGVKDIFGTPSSKTSVKTVLPRKRSKGKKDRMRGRHLLSTTRKPGELATPNLKWNPGMRTLGCHLDKCMKFGDNLRVCKTAQLRDSVFAFLGSVGCFLNSPPNTVHIMNLGIWFNDAKTLDVSMQGFIHFLTSARGFNMTLPHMVWIDTVPQHYPDKGGQYIEGRTYKGKCTPHDPQEMIKYEWRNRSTVKWLKMLAGKGIPVDYFSRWQYLYDKGELHTGWRPGSVKNGQKKSGDLDCSHWCQYDGFIFDAISTVLISDISRKYWRSR